ncbi:uncharacterized protein LOC105191432 [Harpegnathos saltator]|uniref:uncharacterized protein LOC105191432 n=1 Tax=Harpegnathos saltator TaxID=610380 RepID=UPI0005900AF3|nr:uncharacterized protein LOC105191432 [Harpegnathos saltator]XP_011153139.1 uncharacterized protein LOC105191432 [Harpegnathos saltator]XP_025152974.1 uncharacterized protein LOC105191432 [Harpegnathos saltator]
MSHSVTIRTQTVTTSSSAYYINSGYLRTWGGICKLIQLTLGVICVGIVSSIFSSHYNFRNGNEVFFLLMATTFMIGTFIILLSCLTSLSTASVLSKTIYEFIYHAIAFGLLLAASITLLTNIYRHSREYELLLGASICGLINAGFYLISAIIAHFGYRAI